MLRWVVKHYAKSELMQSADIFHNVKRRHTFAHDLAQYGQAEKWVIPAEFGKFKGDCEDWSLACRVLCRKYGIPSRLALCLVETGEMHCVLECGGMILDNRMSEVKAMADLPYKWLAFSGYEPGDDWRAIKRVTFGDRLKRWIKWLG